MISKVRALLPALALLCGLILFYIEEKIGGGFCSLIAALAISLSVEMTIPERISVRRFLLGWIIGGALGFFVPIAGAAASLLVPLGARFLGDRIERRYRRDKLPATDDKLEDLGTASLSLEVPRIMVLTASLGSMREWIVRISDLMAMSGRKVVTVSWDADTTESIAKVLPRAKISSWSEISTIIDDKSLKSARDAMFCLLFEASKHVVLSNREKLLPQSLRRALKVLRNEGLLLDDLIPGVGHLVIDCSDLDPRFREMLSFIVLLMTVELGARDFVLVVPLLTAISEESLRRMSSADAELISWAISEAVRHGCIVITGPDPSSKVLREFRYALLTRGLIIPERSYIKSILGALQCNPIVEDVLLDIRTGNHVFFRRYIQDRSFIRG